MSNSTPTPSGPGFTHQRAARNVFRVVGILAALVALVLVATGLLGFFHSMSSDSMDAPTGDMARFGGGAFLLVVSVALLGLGFNGAGARYAAGEYAPVLKDTAGYLSGGKGILGVGATREPAPAAAPGPYCRACGTRNDADARFCDSCGVSMA